MIQRAGSTLVELLITLVVMAIIAGVVSLAIPQRSAPNAEDGVESLRRRAIASRTTISTTLTLNRHDVLITAYPDGSVLADSALVDRLSGARDAKR